jgi:hypothetical protein
VRKDLQSCCCDPDGGEHSGDAVYNDHSGDLDFSGNLRLNEPSQAPIDVHVWQFRGRSNR